LTLIEEARTFLDVLSQSLHNAMSTGNVGTG
jgi:hypothetical protein